MMEQNITNGSSTDELVIVESYVLLTYKIVGIAQMVANLPVLLVLAYLTIQRKGTKHLIILTMGVTDFMIGCSLIIISETLNRELKFTECLLRCLIAFSTGLASLFHIVAVNIQRIRILTSPLAVHFQNSSMKRDFSLFCFLWIFAAILVFIPFLVLSKEAGYKICTLYYLSKTDLNTLMAWIGVLYGTASFLIILTAIVLFACLIRKLSKPVVQSTGSSTSYRKSRDYKASVTVLIIALLFLVVTLPFLVIWIIYPVKPYLGLSLAFSMLNPIINPFIYLLKVPEFRNIVKKMLKRGNEVHPSTETES